MEIRFNQELVSALVRRVIDHIRKLLRNRYVIDKILLEDVVQFLWGFLMRVSLQEPGFDKLHFPGAGLAIGFSYYGLAVW